MKIIRNIFFISIIPVLVSLGISDAKADNLNQKRDFFVSSQFDHFDRSIISATLLKISDNAYYYIEDSYLNSLNSSQKLLVQSYLDSLADEFENKIYSAEINFWGPEANPGVDGDPRITLLFQNLKDNHGGYFDSVHIYDPVEFQGSNGREMIMVNTDSLGTGLEKVFLAHEFQHLISSNQKEITRDVVEEVWLNELRSQYSIELAGYNNNYPASDLQKRVQAFLADPSDSLTEWPNVSQDYAAVTVFSQYLTDRYGSKILSDSIKSNQVGISSINSALKGSGFPDNFKDVFKNWMIASYINDPVAGDKFFYSNPNLRSLKVRPTEQTILIHPGNPKISHFLKPWQPAWYRFYVDKQQPENKSIKISFESDGLFELAYIDNLGRIGTLGNPAIINNPGGLESFIIMPVNYTKTSGFGGSERANRLTLNISYIDSTGPNAILFRQALKDGSLIRAAGQREIYVVERGYKRFLPEGVLNLYGHLNLEDVIEVDAETFHSLKSSNYVRVVDQEKVFAVWPDGTKHWLNMSGQYFTESGRDWKAIFIINQGEANSYSTGRDIIK